MRGGREESLPRGPEDSLRCARGVFCEPLSSRGDADGVRAAGVAAGAAAGASAAGAGLPPAAAAFSSGVGAALSRAAASAAPPPLPRLASGDEAFEPERYGTVGSGGRAALGAPSSPTEAREPPDPVEVGGAAAAAASLPSAPSAGFSPSPVTWKRTRPGIVMRVLTDIDDASTSLRELPVDAFEEEPDDAANGPDLPEEDDEDAALNSPDSAATKRPLRVEAWLARLGGMVPIDIFAAGPPDIGASTAFTTSKPPLLRRCR